MSKSKQKEYVAKIYQLDGLMVAEASSNSKEDTEREIQHYFMLYSLDGEHTIKRNYNHVEKAVEDNAENRRISDKTLSSLPQQQICLQEIYNKYLNNNK